LGTDGRIGSQSTPSAGQGFGAWVATVDESAVRKTRDVDIMLRRDDLARAITVMEAAGFTYRHVAQMDIFLDEPNGKALDGVNVMFAGELVNPTNPVPNPDLDTVAILNDIPVIPLFELVKIKLTAWRIKDQVHILDMIGVDLIDERWVGQLSPELAERLTALLNDPEG